MPIFPPATSLKRFVEIPPSPVNQDFPDLFVLLEKGYIPRTLEKIDSASGSRVEIILIDDNQEHIAAVHSVLQRSNICNKISVFTSAPDALEFLFRTGRYSNEAALSPETLVLLSLSLQSMHGLDLLRKLRQDERTKSLPVIMLTASQEERGVMQSYKLGASGCIVKPIDLPKFVEAVAELRLGWLLLAPDCPPLE